MPRAELIRRPSTRIGLLAGFAGGTLAVLSGEVPGLFVLVLPFVATLLLLFALAMNRAAP